MGTPKPSIGTRSGSSKVISAKASISKKSQLPNGSILSFFQKAEKLEEHLFVDSGRRKDEDDVGEDTQVVEGEIEETKYNALATYVKKRKLSDTEDQNWDGADATPNEGTATSPKKPRKPKRSANPFIDSSDDEEEPSESSIPKINGKGLETSHSTPVRVELSPDIDKLASDLNSPAACKTRIPDESPGLRYEQSADGDFGEFAGMEDLLEDEDFGGEEFREMRYMEEQARIEAEEEGNYTSEDLAEPFAESDGMAECCPICFASLAGSTPDQATVHVNACLDGIPAPMETPKKSPPQKTKGAEIVVEAHELSKRFARAAVPRPGQANPITLGAGGQSSYSAFAKLMSGHAEDAAWATAAAAENASRGKASYQRTCPFYKIMPGFFICVDAFRYGAVEGCRAYFLSHFHSDHYVGLTANWTHGPIYCSKVTGSLVKSQLRTAAKYIVELEFEKTVPVPDTEGVSVTMIPANHCPGSSLFLFEKAVGSRTQRILHCGDFRACPAHVTHPQLRAETIDSITGRMKQQKIDVCYLDTTYLNPRYSFPPQQDVIRACAELCVKLDSVLATGDDREWDMLLRRREGRAAAGSDDVSKFFASDKNKVTEQSTGPANGEAPGTKLDAFTALKNPNRKRLLVVCGTYSIGKERICKAIARALGTKIFASAAKIRICQQLGDPELAALLTADPAEAQVHMQMLMEIRAETLAEYLDSYRAHGFSRIVGFRPSGWNYRPGSTSAGGGGGSSSSAAGDASKFGPARAVNATANLQPGSLPTTHLLHGAGWRTRFSAGDVVPQRGSSREALCFGVPYSEHSSFRELALFVLALRIERIVPTVNVGSEVGRRRMKGWLDRWIAERRRGGVVRVLEEKAAVEGEKGDDCGGEEHDGEGYIWNLKTTGASAATTNGNSGKEVVLWQGKDGMGGSAWW